MLELELTHIAAGNRETQLDPDHHPLLVPTFTVEDGCLIVCVACGTPIHHSVG